MLATSKDLIMSPPQLSEKPPKRTNIGPGILYIKCIQNFLTYSRKALSATDRSTNLNLIFVPGVFCTNLS